jgi:hypothetical protein
MDKPEIRVRQFTLDDDVSFRAGDDGSRIHSVVIFKNEQARQGPEVSFRGCRPVLTLFDRVPHGCASLSASISLARGVIGPPSPSSARRSDRCGR